MKKLFCLVLSLSLIFSLSLFASAEEYNNDFEQFDVEEAVLENETNANDLYNELLDEVARMNRRRTSASVEYGGAYIGEDGNLVILIANNTQEKEQALSQILNSTAYTTKNCEHSYNYLTSVFNSILSFKESNPDDVLANNIVSHAILDDENIIQVDLLDYNQEFIEQFKEQISDSEAITFEQGEEIVLDATDLSAGGSVSGILTGTIGYRAKVDGKAGIVTNAHVAGGVGDKVKVSGVEVGKVTKSQNSGSVDAAFVEITNSNYTPSNKISGLTSTLSSSTATVAVGTTVNMRGQKSGTVTGKITSINVSVTISGITKKKL